MSLSRSVSSVVEAGRSSLVIENVTLRDAGTYVCLAENSVGTIRALSFVRIRGEYFQHLMTLRLFLFVLVLFYIPL